MTDHLDNFNDGFDALNPFNQPEGQSADDSDPAPRRWPHGTSVGESWVNENDTGPVTLADGSRLEMVRDPHLGWMLFGGQPPTSDRLLPLAGLGDGGDEDDDGGDDEPPPGAAMPPSVDDPDPAADRGGSGAPPTGPPAGPPSAPDETPHTAGQAAPGIDWDDEPEADAPQGRPEPSAPLTCRDQALRMAERGFRVFPVAAGSKQPPLVKFKDEATTDPATIKGWFARWPDANYGIASGGGALVVDLDLKGDTDGRVSLNTLEAAHGVLPGTLKVATPGGGRHLYFQGPEVQGSVNRLGPGIDIRSAGGYVVGPGSVIDGKAYTIEADVPVAGAPEWLVLSCGEPKARDAGAAVSIDHPDDIKFAIHYLKTDARPAIEGRGGNDTTYATAARLLEIGISTETATDLLEEFYNPRCQPSWSRDEIVRIAANAGTYAQARQGSGGVTALADQGGEPADALSVTAPAHPSAHQPRPLGEWVGADSEDDDVAWLVPDVLLTEGVGFLSGAPNAGKSALAMLLAGCLSRGTSFFGHDIPEQSGTIIVSAEGSKAMTVRRLKALATDGEKPPAIAALCSSGFSKSELDALEREIRFKAEHMWKGHGFPVRLLVVDTLGATGLLDDENDNAEVQRVFGSFRALGRALGMFILFTHHPTKAASDQLSGAGALRRTADVALFVQESDHGIRKVNVFKHRDGPTGPLGEFRIQPVQLDLDKQGKPKWSIRAVETQAGPSSDELIRQRIEAGPDGPGTFWRCDDGQSEDSVFRAFADALKLSFGIENGKLKLGSNKKLIKAQVETWAKRGEWEQFEAADKNYNRRLFIKLCPRPNSEEGS